MIDVHCHLADNKFKDDVDEVIENAKKMGVQKMIVVPEFESQFEKVIELAKKYPEVVFPGIGVHPIQKRGRSVQLKHLAKVEQFLMAHEKEVVCVGEVGLDHTVSQFKLTEEDFKIQEIVFKRQIEMAKHFRKPLNVHSRSAARRTIEVLLESEAENVILHAFDGNEEDARIAIKAGYLFSIPPSFTRDEKMTKIVELIPIHLLLLETDSPALGPVKGVKNVPENACISANFISKVKGVPVEEIIHTTSSNANRVFKF